MGKKFRDIHPALAQFISEQKLFFVSSAPLRGGHVNVSPKGYDTLRILSPTRLYYLDLTGSGVETVAHMKEPGNGRICLMWISFGENPQIVRVWGRGRAVEPGSREYEETVEPKLKALPGARAAIIVDVLMTGNSCGYTVPFFEFKSERTLLLDRAYRRTANDPHDIEYHKNNNMWSIDQLVGLETYMPKGPAWYAKAYAPYLRRALEAVGTFALGAGVAVLVMRRLERRR
ncbi:hypothetical protein DFJ74DRAFT_704976 [Hyaloraphidium curvatum]|nr:hypothetical protein DFJ74DRAFT_704976 [Hyaloraphidium curvatum]